MTADEMIDRMQGRGFGMHRLITEEEWQENAAELEEAAAEAVIMAGSMVPVPVGQVGRVGQILRRIPGLGPLLERIPGLRRLVTPAAENAATLSNQALRGIRSLEKQIAQHEAKLAEFIKNPTVRPGMEGQSKAVIEAAQQARIRHLQREIDAFKGNIEKLKKGGG
ncbi:MAG: hypothetical protein ACREIA_16600 [Opitutaceae bacterium]